MRKVNKDFTKVPASLANQQNDLKNITKAQSESLKYDGDDVKEALKEIYNEKCAYCERLTEGEIEHYRPKNSVSLKDLPKKHKAGDYGYFWLRIEWSNLLYACPECNKPKGIRFPLENPKDRIKSPTFDKTTGLPTNTNITDLDDKEKPLLINPEITDPRNHLIVNAIGEICARNQSAKGKATIEVCRLQRSTLILKRKTIINAFANRIKTQLDLFLDGTSSIEQLKKQLFAIFQDIKEAENEKREYTLVAYCIWQNIKDMLLSERAERLQKLILRFFYEFCE